MDWPFLVESVSGLAIKQFAARGGELVHLVSLVHLVCLVFLVYVVRGMNQTR